MEIISSIEEMRAESTRRKRDGLTVGLVPTMGALHEGHLSLIRRARELSRYVVVSVFVNPIQFGPAEDLDSYPADLERDSALCATEGAEALFFPSRAAMYDSTHSAYVLENDLSSGLCGRSRPNHFRGVTTVVAKLFNIVLPDVAVFGRKDAQQARVIERMTRDLNFPVRIVTAPIVREHDGLAMSSRNAYLSTEERFQARCLFEALCTAERLYAEGEPNSAVLKKSMEEVFSRYPAAEVEYIELVDYDSLKPVELVAGTTLAAVCVRMGRARLIDNTILGE